MLNVDKMLMIRVDIPPYSNNIINYLLRRATL